LFKRNPNISEKSVNSSLNDHSVNDSNSKNASPLI